MKSSRLLVLAAFVLCTIQPGFSQEARGTIHGRVTDPQDSVVPGATVRVSNAATGLTSTVQSNEQGQFSAPYLPLGMYTVTAESKGFKKVVRDNVEVRVNDRLE